MIKKLDIAIANEMIGTIDIKGKEYAQVNERIKAFRLVYPDGIINTDLIKDENGECIFKAQVGYYEDDIDGCVRWLATGYAKEKEDASFINKTSYIENCETSAVGRALGMCGFGIDVSVASAEEVQNAINNQELTQEEADNYTLTFGKFKGMTFKEIEKENPGYIDWLLDNTKDERILKIIELSLGIIQPTEEEQQIRLESINKINNIIIEKDIDLEKIKTKFKVDSLQQLDTKTLEELVEYLENK